MQTTKSQLKLILKECLKELLAEGALGNMGMMQPQMMMVPVPQQGQPSFGGYPPPAPMNPAISSRAQMIAHQASGGNAQQAKILESVLMDAAEESEAQDNGVLTQNQQHKLSQERQQLQSFGNGSMGRWASLAFNTQPTLLSPGQMLK